MKRSNYTTTGSCADKGYTFVELIVAMTLTAILATSVIAAMSPASKVYMQIRDLSRAQVVADNIVDALREECADTYIEDFASVRIVNTTPDSSGDSSMLLSLNEITSPSAPSGNVLIIRKSGGYCEAVYSCLNISYQNYLDIKDNDHSYKNENGISSKAVYRFFDGTGNATSEAGQGYVHYGYYRCGRSVLENVVHGGEVKSVSCIFPAEPYDYTNPFSTGAYNGYTVDISFSDLTYTLAPGETQLTLYSERPESVTVTVDVYKCDYAGQTSSSPVYSRKAILIFAEDTTK